jgi:3-hydroxyacyl-[acyl-carrier-protein] dehydratase
MHFRLIDAVVERGEDRIVAIKHVSSAEEYLQDHFPSFPVLPGVLMLEAMVQAGRELLEARGVPAEGPAGERPQPERPVTNRPCQERPVGNRPNQEGPLVLGRVRALKYGRFVRPGSSLRVEVRLLGRADDGGFDLKGHGVVIEPDAGAESSKPRIAEGALPTAVSGRFTLRPARIRWDRPGAGPCKDGR